MRLRQKASGKVGNKENIINSNEVMNAVGFSEVSHDELVMVNGGFTGISFEPIIDEGGNSSSPVGVRWPRAPR